MSLCKEKIENLGLRFKEKAGKRKWRKNQFNRYIRRKKIYQAIIMKFKKGWEY